MVPNFVSHRQKQFCFISKTDINQIHVARKRLYKFPSAVLCCSHNAWWGSKQKRPRAASTTVNHVKETVKQLFFFFVHSFLCISLTLPLSFLHPTITTTNLLSHEEVQRREEKEKQRVGGRLEDWLEAERRNGWAAHETQKQPEMTLFTLIKEHLSKTSFPHRYMENNCFFS